MYNLANNSGPIKSPYSLDVEHRVFLHSLLPLASPSELSKLLMEILREETRQIMAVNTSAILNKYLPFTRCDFSSLPPSPVSSIRAPYRRHVLSLAENSTAGVTELANYFLTERKQAGESFDDSSASEEFSVDSFSPQLFLWFQRFLDSADGENLRNLEEKCRKIGLQQRKIQRDEEEIQRKLLEERKNSIVEAKEFSSTVASTAPERQAENRNSPAAQEILLNGGSDLLCLILSFLSLPFLAVSPGVANRRWFSAAFDQRCLRGLRRWKITKSPVTAQLHILFRKAANLEYLQFGEALGDSSVLGLVGPPVPPPSQALLSRLVKLSFAHCASLTDLSLLRLVHRRFIDDSAANELLSLARLRAQELLGLGAQTPRTSTAPTPARKSSIATIAEESTAAINPAACLVPHLTDLDLTACNSLSDAGLIFLLPQCVSLRRISFRLCANFSPVAFRILARHARHLTSLDVSGFLHLIDSCLKLVSAGCHSLEILIAQECPHISPLAIQHLAIGCPALQRIDATGSPQFIDDRACQILAPLAQLRQLQISGSLLTNSGMSALALSRSLTSLDLSSGRRCSELSDGGILALANSPASKTIVELNLSGCDELTDEAIEALARCCGRLRKLDVSRCLKLTNRCLFAVSDDFAPLRNSLEVFHIGFCYEIRDVGVGALIRCPRLIELSVPQCLRVTDHSLAISLRSIREGSSALRSLDFFRCPISDKAFRAWKTNKGEEEKKFQQVEALFLGECPALSDAGLATFLPRCPGLLRLTISGCPLITDATLKNIARNCPKLNALTLSHCGQVSDVGVLALTSVCCFLKEFRLEEISISDDAVQRGIAENLKELQILDLTRCVRITVASLVSLLACVDLTFLNVSQCPHIASVAERLAALDSGGSLRFSATPAQTAENQQYSHCLTMFHRRSCLFRR